MVARVAQLEEGKIAEESLDHISASVLYFFPMAAVDLKQLVVVLMEVAETVAPVVVARDPGSPE